ncbi:hypothetical protein [Caballeronia glebae]|uniref:hypothetical protein n=1 Tax=Caballeronia glebae TaxID=1777143 RepID=UPI0038B7F65B
MSALSKNVGRVNFAIDAMYCPHVHFYKLLRTFPDRKNCLRNYYFTLAFPRMPKKSFARTARRRWLKKKPPREGGGFCGIGLKNGQLIWSASNAMI